MARKMGNARGRGAVQPKPAPQPKPVPPAARAAGPVAPKRPAAPSRQVSQAPLQRSGGASPAMMSTFGDPGASMGGAIPGGAPVNPAVGSDGAPNIDWLRANDGEFTAAEAAYKNVFDQLAATLNRENSNYELDHGTALKNLGWIDEDGDAGPGQAAWAMNNVDTAAGRGYRSIFDDFAGRGMLQGSAFGEAENSLRTSLDKQRDMLGEQRSQFLNSQRERRTQGEQTRDNSIKMAAAQALARVAAGMGV